MKDSKIYLKILINIVIFVIACLFLIFVLPNVLVFFMPFVIGLIIAMIANPLVKFLEKKVKIIPKHSSAIIIILVIGAVIGIGYLVISFLIREMIEFSNDWEDLIKNFTFQMQEVTLWFDKVTKPLPGNIPNVFDNITSSMIDYVKNISFEFGGSSLEAAGNLVNNIADIFVLAIMTILSAYFFIADRDDMLASLKKIIPDSLQNSIQLIITQFKTAIGGYFKAQFKIMCIITVIIFIGLEILQVNYSFLLALVIAFLDLLPFFGTGAVFWPWAIIEFITGNYMKGIGMLVIYLVCQVVKQILQPKLVGDSIGISPFATLVFMFVGYRVYGVIGMIFGIPIGMVIVSFYRNGMFDGVLNGFKLILKDFNEFRKLK